ncbi:indolepyruvate ferredoxin oxidoreductase subunit alpha [candidate division WOR-3 bacterium RBG_13_43_14]|uniref:Indolepyruvate oxidoreductase subunit IorA n=1 Tax=candidate division WOR-3 bacterium RBG_13_43_14 TaxID=1802590 RepID=A0A1F4UGG6_UNCW3|nr:MAG: indolepyruvate ferredoxin oxidoreductase subunit alpha [candidate division WOR-3 bacterium RBG_13_43_14]
MKTILSGNEAVARGAWEAGCKVAAAYPGTPSTEILENIILYPEIYAEWSINEKVALEVAAGASFAGCRSLVAMKHVGLNVAADPLFTMAYSGVTGGFVIVNADDPGMWSSQNEQDNRHYARHAKIPMLEPSDSQEARIFVKLGFEISEQFDTPVLLRLTTRICHSTCLVDLDDRIEHQISGYTKNIKKRLVLPAHARLLHIAVEERMKKLAEYSEKFLYNQIEWGQKKLGIITSGISYQYAKEVFPKASFLKLAFTYPLPEKLIREFSRQVRNVIIIEEGDPILETEIKAMGIKATGKARIPVCGELTPKVIKESFNIKKLDINPEPAPVRPPVLCPGCPHRGVFYIINKLNLVATGDIGCYTLSALPPLNAMDTCICMGASITNAHGLDKALGKEFSNKMVAVLGDSTFFHSGITGLVNAVYNKGNLNLIIVDNYTTAMTGHQPHPGTGKLAHGETGKRIPPEDIARGCGVEFVKTVNPDDLEETENTIKEALEFDGVTVLVFRRPCALLLKRKIPYYVDSENCKSCNICMRIGCPAISLTSIPGKEKEIAVIDADLCFGCGLCAQVCTCEAIKLRDIVR